MAGLLFFLMLKWMLKSNLQSNKIAVPFGYPPYIRLQSIFAGGGAILNTHVRNNLPQSTAPSRRKDGGTERYAETPITAPIPRRSGKWESRGTSPSGAVRAGPPAAQANGTVKCNGRGYSSCGYNQNYLLAGKSTGRGAGRSKAVSGVQKTCSFADFMMHSITSSE